MNKAFNTMRGGFGVALANLRRHGIRVYGTFIFGYDGDTPERLRRRRWSSRSSTRFYIAAFNHLTPFPGTPLYRRLEREGRLLYERWWLDERYSYNGIPFQPARMAPDDVRTRLPRRAAQVLSLAEHHAARLRPGESRATASCSATFS